MNLVRFVITLFLVVSCVEQNTKELTAQQLVDKSIEASGGNLYRTSAISFDFRDKTYTSETAGSTRVLKRITKTDSSEVVDVRTDMKFQRFVNDSLVVLPDTLAVKYSNSVNSVHYFAYLPYGLNDPAVNKELIGKITLKNKEYYKIKITFDQQGGGDDFKDIYVYWLNAETFKPDYLAYVFYEDGGGMRFREAFNERYVGGIRFVDYHNYKPKLPIASIQEIDKAFESGGLELLSTIELTNITLE
ncbi:MAG: DUF6503 family protein [Flavobacteriaceae bacterium]